MNNLHCTLCIEDAKIDGNDVRHWNLADCIYRGSSLCIKHFLALAPKKDDDNAKL